MLHKSLTFSFHVCSDVHVFSFRLRWQEYKTNSQLAAWSNEGDDYNSTLSANFAITDSYIWCVRPL